MLEHDPEKWEPVFRKDHAPPMSWSGMTIRRKVITLWVDADDAADARRNKVVRYT
jgi:hypothetical protein